MEIVFYSHLERCEVYSSGQCSVERVNNTPPSTPAGLDWV